MLFTQGRPTRAEADLAPHDASTQDPAPLAKRPTSTDMHAARLLQRLSPIARHGLELGQSQVCNRPLLYELYDSFGHGLRRCESGLRSEGRNASASLSRSLIAFADINF